ncbi:hypothetical protein C8R46DRAFT_850991, partial [Mycena filopes]
MPLMTSWESPTGWQSPFATIGEAVDFFFHQIFEGLQFMHNNHVWHGDCKANNLMMDASPVLRDVPHPRDSFETRDFSRPVRPLRSRTQHPVRYNWIDFDLSGAHNPSSGPPAVNPGYGGVRNVPKFAFKDQKCNPFAVDVWCLGYMWIGVLRDPQIPGFRINGRTCGCQDPAQWPSMDEVVRQFSQIKTRLSDRKLRSPLRTADSRGRVGILQCTIHWARQLYFVARRIPAIP